MSGVLAEAAVVVIPGGGGGGDPAMGGDLSGTASNATVDAIQGVVVTMGSPSDGQVLGIVGGVVEPITSTARPIAAVSTSNLLLHLRSDSGVSLSGSAVTGWASTVGSHTAAPPNAGARPTFIAGEAGGIGGRAVVRFDGSNDVLVVPYSALLNASTISLYVVARMVGKTNGTLSSVCTPIGRPFADPITNPFFDWSLFVPNGSENQIRPRANSTFLSTGIFPGASTTDESWVANMTVGAAGFQFFWNGKRLGSDAGKTSVTYTNNLGICIGAGYVPGGGYSEGCLMDVAEVLLYGVQHTAAERAAINESLFSYYGLNGYASISS